MGKLIKILRLAVDSRTQESEALAAVLALRRCCSNFDLLVKEFIQEYNDGEAYREKQAHFERERNGSCGHKTKQKSACRGERPGTHNEPVDDEKLRRAIEQFRDITICFGKHQGERVSWVAKNDYGYLVWVLENCERLAPRTRQAFLNAAIIYRSLRRPATPEPEPEREEDRFDPFEEPEEDSCDYEDPPPFFRPKRNGRSRNPTV